MKLLFPFSRQKKWLFLFCYIVYVANLAGCKTNTAPVVTANANKEIKEVKETPKGYYRVQQGDNLYRIGLKYGQTVNTLMQWNNLPNSDVIEVDQLIRVTNPHSGSTHSNTHQNRPSSHTSQNRPSGTLAPNVSLAWPVQGNIVTHFNGHSQKGIDIAGRQGTPIKAAGAGTVQYAGDELRGYGKLILIKHSNTTMTAYAYNDKLLVRNGQKVVKGEQIATMGNSGNATMMSLHFEIRVNSQAVDPLRYLPN